MREIVSGDAVFIGDSLRLDEIEDLKNIVEARCLRLGAFIYLDARFRQIYARKFLQVAINFVLVGWKEYIRWKIVGCIYVAIRT